jgi:hypothetical protein
MPKNLKTKDKVWFLKRYLPVIAETALAVTLTLAALASVHRLPKVAVRTALTILAL